MELVVYRIFNFMKKAVVRIVMDFVQDSNGRIWLLGSRDCVVVSERKPDRCVVCYDERIFTACEEDELMILVLFAGNHPQMFSNRIELPRLQTWV